MAEVSHFSFATVMLEVGEIILPNYRGTSTKARPYSPAALGHSPPDVLRRLGLAKGQPVFLFR